MAIPFLTKSLLPPVDSRSFRWALLIATALVFSMTLSLSSFKIRDYAYHLGDVAEEDIKAPRDLLIKDTKATEEKRAQAGDRVLTVYDYNDTLVEQINRQLAVSFELARNALLGKTSSADASAKPGHDLLWEYKPKFEQTLGISVSNGAYGILEKEKFSKTIEALIGRIVTEILANGVVANKENLLRERDRGIVLSTVSNQQEEIVTNLRRFYGLDQAQIMVRVVGEPLLADVDYTVKNLIVDFAQRLITPNITLNINKTEKRRQDAQASISQVAYEVKKGEMILREGQRINELDLLKLESLRAEAKNQDSLAASLGAALIGALVFFVVYLRNSESSRRGVLADNKNLLFFATMLCLSLIAARVAFAVGEAMAFSASSPDITPQSIFLAIPLAASAMIVCLFMNIELTASFALILALCTGAIFNNNFEVVVYSILNLTMAAFWMQHCRERKVFIKAGAKLGLFNVAAITAINLYRGDLSGTGMLIDWGMAFFGGFLSGVLTAGLAPIIEMVFDYTTDIKLLELSNLDQPLLKRLMLEAPGTYHHSLVVGAMAEAAASEVGANPLLARVCGYYHDIGKIRKPLYFVENIRDGKNKHDKLAPSMSGLILMSHVKDGVDIARQHRLGKAVVDAIQQHHGTRIIAYFYEKAKRQAEESGKEKEINVNDFRYPGPKPQTREAGLIMLADEIEAAARTLESPTPSRLQGLMQDLINRTFSDGQLNECELTLKDLNNIAKSFNTILSGIYHHRIEYPSAENGKKKDGSPDKQPSKSPPPAPETPNSEKDAGRLKRLGQS
ncbi:MAG: HDIG domain-containing protein [Thermodesulfobacteriota bacterium]|nr:HDIG domain-containing protein [Thermodesulfobacteriota bacterium]